MRILKQLGLSVLLTIAVPSLGWANFVGPIQVSPQGQAATVPLVAMDDNGNALTIWRGADGRLASRYRTAVGVFQPIQVLSTTQVSDYRLAFDADGNALVAWETDGSEIEIRTRFASGALGPRSTVVDVGLADLLDFDINDGGDGIILFRHSNTQVWMRRVDVSGNLGPFQAPETGVAIYTGQAAIDADGTALIVYLEPGHWVHMGPLKVRTLSTAGVRGPIQTLQPSGATTPFAVVGDGAGNNVIVWRDDGELDDQAKVEAVHRSPSGAYGPVSIFPWAHPEIAMNSDGDGILALTNFTPAGITAVTFSSGGVFGTQQEIATGAATYLAQLALNDAGDGVIAWARDTRIDPPTGARRIEARTLSVDGTLGPIQVVSNPHANNPDVAIAPDGDAILVWQRLHSSAQRIQAAIGP